MTVLLTFLRSAPFCPLPLGRDLRLRCSRTLTCGPSLNVAFIKPDLLSWVVRHGWGGEQPFQAYWVSPWITAGSWSSFEADDKVGVSIESTPLGRSRYK